MADIDDLLRIMARLRDPQTGCPWDLQQDFSTIVPHTLEEAYEVAETIERQDFSALRDELGDLLFQVVFYSQIARERNMFTFDQIVDGICAKITRRHPHVFGDRPASDADAVGERWETIKEAERREKGEQHGSALDGLTRALPALTLAAKLQKRAARTGFDWERPEQILDKIQEEIREVQEELHGAERERLQEELGDLLFSCVNLVRYLGFDPEQCMRLANRKFEHRFRRMESEISGQGHALRELDIVALEAAWQRAKDAE